MQLTLKRWKRPKTDIIVGTDYVLLLHNVSFMWMKLTLGEYSCFCKDSFPPFEFPYRMILPRCFVLNLVYNWHLYKHLIFIHKNQIHVYLAKTLSS